MEIEKIDKGIHFIKKIVGMIILMTIFLYRGVCGNNNVEAAVCERLPKLSCKKLTMSVNERKKLKIRYMQQDSKVKWSLSDNSVAKVTRNGKIIAKKRGKTVVKVIVKQKVTRTVLKCRVTVE